MGATVIIDDILPWTQYIATAGQTVFDTTWTADVATDIVVFARADGVTADDATQLVSDVDYTVTFVGSDRLVRVTFAVGRTLDDIVTVTRLTPAQRMNLYNNTNFTPTMLNGDFGRVILMIQQNQFYWEQNIPRYNTSETLVQNVDTKLPLLGANQVWAKNDSNDAIIPYDVPSGGGGLAPSDATYLLQTANANLPNAQSMGALGSGFVVNTNTTGVQLTREMAGTPLQLGVNNANGIGGNPTYFIVDNPTLSGTAGMGIPSGTTAQRVTPTPPSIGLRFNTDINALEYYDSNSASWVAIPSAVAGIFLELAGGTMSGNIDMDNNSVIGLPIPIIGNEAASKDYVDGIAFNVHPAAIYGTVANFASTYDNGAAGVGATLTATSNGAFTTDGQSPSLNDRILVLQQTNQAENGIYVLSTVGDGSNPAVLTRADDYNQSSDMQAGDNVSIVAGDTLAGSKWMMNQTAAITVGTTNITWLNISIPLNVVTLDNAQTITGAKTFQADVDMDTNFITNLADPVNPQDAATRAFVLANDEGLINVQYFTSSGTYNKTSGANFALVVAIGGGGGGGYGAPAAGQAMVGSGGGSGGYGELYLDLTAITSETVTIGAGGTGGVGATTTNATNGGTTSFGALLTALGGVAGEQSNSGAGNFMIRGGLGAVAGAGGNLNIAGTPGFSAQRISAVIYMGGHGGGGFFGGSGRSIATSSGQNNSGGAGQSFGAGGGGGNSSDGTNVNGGNGANGLVIVYEFA